MTAKIDTQAPARIGLIQSPFGFALAHRDEADAAIHYIRADLADARAAAAAQAMREAITNSLRHAITLAEERLAGAVDEPWSTKHDKCVAGQVLYQEAIEYIDRLPLPDTTALDRLIAERVREAFAALDECLEWMEQLRASGDAGFWEWQPGDAYNKGMALIARGSKEGRDG